MGGIACVQSLGRIEPGQIPGIEAERECVRVYLAGLDIGTTGCKLSVFRINGELLGSVCREYPVQRSRSAHEVDAAAIWTAVKALIAEGAKQYPGIAGIGITSFGESFVLLDEKDEPILLAMLYTDPRGEEQADRLVRHLGKKTMVDITGLNPHSMYSLPKLMWVKENLPEAYEKTKRICLMEDYIVYQLTGNAQIDYSLATRTMAFDIRALSWSKRICDAAGIDPALLSRPVPTGTSAGQLKKELTEELGLWEGTIAVSVSHDQVAAAIGSGVFDESRTVDGAGTVQCMTPVFRTCDPSKMAENNYCIVPFVREGSYVTYAFSYTGGALVKWFADNLAQDALQAAREQGISVYDLLEDSGQEGPTGILVLPHFAGAATPTMDGGSKGAIVGLTLSHTRKDLYRAVMEGVCYEMRLNQELLKDSGVAVAPLHATGGGAKSRVWMQMKADVLNVPVTALTTTEAGATGSAMLVGVALGLYPNLEAAAEKMVKVREVFRPRPEIHAQYEAVYQRYKKLYHAVRPLV